MLTKDLLRFKCVGTLVKPSFILNDDQSLLTFAERLLKIHEHGIGSARTDIDSAVESLASMKKDLKLARGIAKIVSDRCVFSGCGGDHDYAALRHKLFERSAALLRSENETLPESYESFRGLVFSNIPEELAPLEKEIYADLPENERLVSIKKTFPKELLDRYNCSLVQSLLLYSAKIEAEVEDSDPAGLRRLFRYLKFFRLLARITADTEKSAKKQSPETQMPKRISIEIDGPASIFENSLKYGLQLASFFPAICMLPKWKICAEIKIRDKKLRLKLDETSCVKSHYSNSGAFIPEEVRMFHDLFSKTVEEWKISAASEFITDTGGKLIFPDFTFKSVQGGQSFDMELFHRWHSTQLRERLDRCEQGAPFADKLIIGVDRALLSSDKGLKKRLEESRFFDSNGFYFKDFPGVENVRKTLESKSSGKLV